MRPELTRLGPCSKGGVVFQRIRVLVVKHRTLEDPKPIVYKCERLGDGETLFAVSSGIDADATVAPVTTTASV